MFIGFVLSMVIFCGILLPVFLFTEQFEKTNNNEHKCSNPDCKGYNVEL